METNEIVALVYILILMIGMGVFTYSIVWVAMNWKCLKKLNQERYNRHHKYKIADWKKTEKEWYTCNYKPKKNKVDKVNDINKIQNNTVSFATQDVREVKKPESFESPKPKKHSGRCDGDCKNCPPHYGYRYGRWYYGHSHSEGCEFGGNKCDGGRD